MVEKLWTIHCTKYVDSSRKWKVQYFTVTFVAQCPIRWSGFHLTSIPLKNRWNKSAGTIFQTPNGKSSGQISYQVLSPHSLRCSNICTGWLPLFYWHHCGASSAPCFFYQTRLKHSHPRKYMPTRVPHVGQERDCVTVTLGYDLKIYIYMYMNIYTCKSLIHR